MMLGMAANSSIALATGFLIQAGAISAMKTATPKLTGTPRIIAIAELMRVLMMNGKAPKVCVTGFQSLDLRNPQIPNAWIAVRLSAAIATTVAKSAPATRMAAKTAAL